MLEFDDVCEINKETGICSRHKIKHENRFLKLSQDKTIIGHNYRKQWDKEFGELTSEPDFADICKFNEKGMCLRHFVKHEGIAFIWSQDNTLIGWRIRREWDKLVVKNNGVIKECNCLKLQGNLK